MGHLVERDSELSIDLESQEHTNKQQGNKYLGRVWSGIINVDGVTSSSSTTLSKSSGEDDDTLALLGNQRVVNDKRKKSATKKPPKPPRPPGGPSFDVADQKLVREISEIAMLKRARRERVKAQKKAKLAKSSPSPSSSSLTSLCAMIVTLLFCLIIIFQGILSRKSPHAIFDGSPESAIVNKGPLISVQYYKSPSSSSKNPSFESPSLVEQVSGSDPVQERSRDVG